MRIPGRKAALRSARWLRSRFVDHGVILGYHRISEGDEWDPFDLSVAPRNFAEHMEVLRELATPLPLAELADARERGSFPPGAVTVTFDDGYADNLTGAVPLLERHGIPSTIFVVTDYLGAEFWWDELARLTAPSRRIPSGLRVAIAGRLHEWSLEGSGGEDGRKRLLFALHDRLVTLDADRREDGLAQLRAALGSSAEPSPLHRALQPEELGRLSRHGLVEIGAHTRSHASLDVLGEGRQRDEIAGGKRHLEELLGEPVSSFSYPHGSSSPQTEAIVRECGFRRACTSRPDVVRRATDRFRLPRFWVPNWTGGRFARWLSRWLRGRGGS